MRHRRQVFGLCHLGLFHRTTVVAVAVRFLLENISVYVVSVVQPGRRVRLCIRTLDYCHRVVIDVFRDVDSRGYINVDDGGVIIWVIGLWFWVVCGHGVVSGITSVHSTLVSGDISGHVYCYFGIGV